MRFKILFGLNFFKKVSFFPLIVSHYDNEYETKEDKNQTGLNTFKPKIYLNHNNYKIHWFGIEWLFSK